MRPYLPFDRNVIIAFEIREFAFKVFGQGHAQTRALRKRQPAIPDFRWVCQDVPLQWSLDHAQLEHFRVGQGGYQVGVGHRHQAVVPVVRAQWHSVTVGDFGNPHRLAYPAPAGIRLDDVVGMSFQVGTELLDRGVLLTAGDRDVHCPVQAHIPVDIRLGDGFLEPGEL